MICDFRIMASLKDEEVLLEVHQVFYDDNGNLKKYTLVPTLVDMDNVSNIARLLLCVKEASRKPIIWKGDRFPSVFILADYE